ncbi:MAG: site-specific integrase [Nitrosotalea sp.]
MFVLVKPIRLFGKKVTEQELFTYIKKRIDAGIDGTSELGAEIGKEPRQTRRYLVKMAELGLVLLDPNSGRVTKTSFQDQVDKMEKLNMDKFLQNPTIKEWYEKTSANVKADTLSSYVSSLKSIFKEMPENPKAIVASRSNALQYWQNFRTQWKQKTGKSNVSHELRVAFRSFLGANEISFANKEGKKFGLGSEHDAFKKFAGVSLVKFIPRLKQLMIDNKDAQTLLWFDLGLRTSARGGSIATMVWERIYFDFVDDDGTESFKIEIHETKVEKDHYHLGENGLWFDYYPTLELKQLFKDWKASHPDFRRFVWFEDTGTDAQNVARSERVHAIMAKKLSEYYKQIENEFDPLLAEFIKKRPNHIMPHTFAQILKDKGWSDDKIAATGHWTDPQAVSWYCKTNSDQVKSNKRDAGRIEF